MEDQPDPCQSSSYYRRHLDFFEVDPEEKTIKAVVVELKTKVKEDFIRKCHYYPETYDFKTFRLTRTYKLYRELINYLTKLSSWLYRGEKIPVSLKKAFSKNHSFVNPYEYLTPDALAEEGLPQLNNLMLSVAYNLNVCDLFPNPQLRDSLLKEMRSRNIDVSKIGKSTDILIEVIKKGNQEEVVLLQKDPE